MSDFISFKNLNEIASNFPEVYKFNSNLCAEVEEASISGKWDELSYETASLARVAISNKLKQLRDSIYTSGWKLDKNYINKCGDTIERTEETLRRNVFIHLDSYKEVKDRVKQELLSEGIDSASVNAAIDGLEGHPTGTQKLNGDTKSQLTLGDIKFLGPTGAHYGDDLLIIFLKMEVLSRRHNNRGSNRAQTRMILLRSLQGYVRTCHSCSQKEANLNGAHVVSFVCPNCKNTVQTKSYITKDRIVSFLKTSNNYFGSDYNESRKFIDSINDKNYLHFAKCASGPGGVDASIDLADLQTDDPVTFFICQQKAYWRELNRVFVQAGTQPKGEAELKFSDGVIPMYRYSKDTASLIKGASNNDILITIGLSERPADLTKGTYVDFQSLKKHGLAVVEGEQRLHSGYRQINDIEIARESAGKSGKINVHYASIINGNSGREINLETCQSIASLFSSEEEWRESSPKLWSYVVMKGWRSHCNHHMTGLTLRKK